MLNLCTLMAHLLNLHGQVRMTFAGFPIHILFVKYTPPLTDTGRTYNLSKDNEKKITDTFNRM